jgi:hypothetical protein
MQGVESFEIIDAEPAKLIKNYRKTKHKLFNTNTSDKCMYPAHYMHSYSTTNQQDAPVSETAASCWLVVLQE